MRGRHNRLRRRRRGVQGPDRGAGDGPGDRRRRRHARKSIIGEKPIGALAAAAAGPPGLGPVAGSAAEIQGDAPGGSALQVDGEAPGGKFGQNICCAIDGGPLGWGWPVGSSILANVCGDCSTPNSLGTQP